MPRKGQLFVGTSGWNYKHWGKGVFYPADLPAREWLACYAEHFRAAEINNSFYRLPERKTFEKWRESTPRGFRFAVKASRYITHMKKLKDVDEHGAQLLTHAAGLKEKLGVILFQLPPRWKFNSDRLEALGKFVQSQSAVRNLRAALEIRDPSWNCEDCFSILRKYHLALAVSDWRELKIEGPQTADFHFLRRHGPEQLYASAYSGAALKKDAKRIREFLNRGEDVYLFFNNDAQGYAVKNATRIRELLGDANRLLAIRFATSPTPRQPPKR